MSGACQSVLTHTEACPMHVSISSIIPIMRSKHQIRVVSSLTWVNVVLTDLICFCMSEVCDVTLTVLSRPQRPLA